MIGRWLIRRWLLPLLKVLVLFVRTVSSSMFWLIYILILESSICKQFKFWPGIMSVSLGNLT